MTSDDPLHYFDLTSAISKPDNEWNVPDWKKSDEYPGQKTPDWEWRWEFIRRHPHYRNAWQRYQKDPENWQRKRREGLSRAELLARRILLPVLPHPTRQNNHSFFELNMERSLCDVTPAFNGGCADFCDAAEKRGQYLVAITPTKNLDKQLEKIRKDVLNLNKEWQWSPIIKQEKPARRKFPLYLRVIDARDKNASLGVIAKVLSQERHSQVINKTSVRNIRDSARAMQKYLLLEEMPVS